MIEQIKPIFPNGNNKEIDILLINSPTSFKENEVIKHSEPPFGQLRIASVLEEHGLKPSILDLCKYRMDPKDIENILINASPKMVGLNPTSVNIKPTQLISQICKKNKIPLIIGGVQATLDPEQTLKQHFPMAEAVIKGKGEYAVLNLILNYLSNENNKIRGVYKKDDNFLKRSDFGKPYPINKIPMINQFKYIENPLLEKQIVFNGKKVELKEISLYETSGCPFDCAFCATPSLTDRSEKIFEHPGIPTLLRDVKFALSKGANAVHFLDDMTITSVKQAYEFYEGITKINKPNGFYWRGMTRAPIIANQFKHKDLEILKKSGCWRITMGIESGNQNILNKINKRITKDEVRAAINKLKKAGIEEIKAFFIMGFPNESLTEILETQDFIMELKKKGLTDISLFQFKPYPGTKIYQDLIKTNPEILKKITFGYSPEDESNIDIVKNKLGIDASLPDNLKIAQISSYEVRKIIIKTLEKFYGK